LPIPTCGIMVAIAVVVAAAHRRMFLVDVTSVR
jgi:hypothetical protein